MSSLLREPLVHFLALGALLFAAFALFGAPAETPSKEIRVTRGQVEALAAGFEKTWLRKPSSTELDGLVEEHVREEIYCREALALGLDKDDAVIRRRLRQKMEFISEETEGQVEPTDAELSAYLAAHGETFSVDGKVPPLSEIRDRLRMEWANARRLAAGEAAFRTLKSEYSVSIER